MDIKRYQMVFLAIALTQASLPVAALASTPCDASIYKIGEKATRVGPRSTDPESAYNTLTITSGSAVRGKNSVEWCDGSKRCGSPPAWYSQIAGYLYAAKSSVKSPAGDMTYYLWRENGVETDTPATMLENNLVTILKKNALRCF